MVELWKVSGKDTDRVCVAYVAACDTVTQAICLASQFGPGRYEMWTPAGVCLRAIEIHDVACEAA